MNICVLGLCFLSLLLTACGETPRTFNESPVPDNSSYSSLAPDEVGNLFLISLQNRDWDKAKALCSEGFRGSWQDREQLEREEEARVSSNGKLLSFFLKEETASGNLYTLDYFTFRPGFKGKYSSAFLIEKSTPDERQILTLKLTRYEKIGWKLEGYYTSNVVKP